MLVYDSADDVDVASSSEGAENYHLAFVAALQPKTEPHGKSKATSGR